MYAKNYQQKCWWVTRANQATGARETAQQLPALSALPEDPGSLPSSSQLPITPPGEPMPSYGLLRPGALICAYRQTYICKMKNEKRIL